jgi:hypothetical protein
MDFEISAVDDMPDENHLINENSIELSSFGMNDRENSYSNTNVDEDCFLTLKQTLIKDPGRLKNQDIPYGTMIQVDFVVSNIPISKSIGSTLDLENVEISEVKSEEKTVDITSDQEGMAEDNLNGYKMTIDEIDEEKLEIAQISIKSKNNDKYDWEIMDFLGQGAMGTVYKAHDQKSNQDFALKILNFQKFNDRKFKKARHEIFILNILQKEGGDQKNILTLCDYFLDKDESSQKFGKSASQFSENSNLATEKENRMIIIMKIASISLEEIFEFRRENNIFWMEEELLYILKTIVDGLTFARYLGIAHRDIKPDNILFSIETQRFLIADWSEAKLIKTYSKKKAVHNTR